MQVAVGSSPKPLTILSLVGNSHSGELADSHSAMARLPAPLNYFVTTTPLSILLVAMIGALRSYIEAGDN